VQAQRASRGFDQQKMNQRSHAKLRSAETGERRRTCRVPKREFLASNKKHQRAVSHASLVACQLSRALASVKCKQNCDLQHSTMLTRIHNSNIYRGQAVCCLATTMTRASLVTTRITRESHPWGGEGELEQDLGSQPSLTCTTRFSCKAPPRPDPQDIALPLHTQGCYAVKCAQERCCVLGPT
jgi:hypothetical protein